MSTWWLLYFVPGILLSMAVWSSAVDGWRPKRLTEEERLHMDLTEMLVKSDKIAKWTLLAILFAVVMAWPAVILYTAWPKKAKK